MKYLTLVTTLFIMSVFVSCTTTKIDSNGVKIQKSRSLMDFVGAFIIMNEKPKELDPTCELEVQ